MPPSAAVSPGSLDQIQRKSSAPAKFSLLAKGHNVAPSGHSSQAVVLRPTRREKFPGGWRKGYLNRLRGEAGTLPEGSGPGEQLGCAAKASEASAASVASSGGIVGMVGKDARMRGRAQ